jgi:hypothetical protein
VLVLCLLGLAAIAALRGEPEAAGQQWAAERLGMRLDTASRAHYYKQAIATLSAPAAERFESARTSAMQRPLDDVPEQGSDIAGCKLGG